MAPGVVSIASGKGGVGKTTTVANLSVALGDLGVRVLAWDLDGQGNLTQALGLAAQDVGVSSYHLMTSRVLDLGDAIVATEFPGVSLVPSQMELFAAEYEAGGAVGKEYLIRGLLAQEVAQQFEVVLFDLPPNLGFHTINGLTASRWVLVPLQMSGFALSGLRQLAHAVRLVQDRLNPELELMGLLPTFVSDRTLFSRELLEALEMMPGTHVFGSRVPYTVRVAESTLTGLPVVRAVPRSEVARAYVAAAEEMRAIIKREPAHVAAAPAPAIAAPPRARSVVTSVPPFVPYETPRQAPVSPAPARGGVLRRLRDGLFAGARRPQS